ncbi:hypothetical protein Bca4012_043705 [Brassica carinata]|uniref:Transmembrane protein, (DUF1191) n=3 Tax=Brassica TaxID=3705 RepID=A0A8X7QSU7_BRACI|nr:uncharacterized protein LOC111205089 [Brassica napus]KAG2276095.1 hypothetical protein Bca52824_058650 [Brassica carinata]CAF1743431.1 unnamed protein product [Brassica napus]VDD30971.1 unnamed protein product [Brassica oleracea]
MDSIPFIFIILLFHLQKSKPQTIQSAHLLDLMIRDYTIRNFNIHVKTGTVQKIHLPANFSSIDIDTAKFRCGSLKRHGARIGEFHFGPGLSVQPCVERVILVRQNLGLNWSSSIYSTGYNLTGYNYQLVTPVLGLLAYNSNPDGVAVNPYEVNLMGTEKDHILIDFLSIKSSGSPRSVNSSLLCACFTSNGNITFKEQVSAYVCLGTAQGHYALVAKHHEGSGGGGVITPSSSPGVNNGGGGKLSRWKVAVGSVIGSVIGALLLGLLVVAMLVKGKKKAMREEIEQRAYEEEALQVSMVGHVRANPNNRYSSK